MPRPTQGDEAESRQATPIATKGISNKNRPAMENRGAQRRLRVLPVIGGRLFGGW